VDLPCKKQEHLLKLTGRAGHWTESFVCSTIEYLNLGFNKGGAVDWETFGILFEFENWAYFLTDVLSLREYFPAEIYKMRYTNPSYSICLKVFIWTLLVVLVTAFGACSAIKRKYRTGFYIESNSTSVIAEHITLPKRFKLLNTQNESLALRCF
jgi:cytochrome c oxidase subunit IV